MKWEFVENKPNLQIDTVGNIVQVSGGVKTKACQKCKTLFDCKPSNVPKTQQVPSYICEQCNFKNNGAPAALDHKIETDHTIKKIMKERIVSYDKKIVGNVAYITKVKNDVIIICGECNGNKS